jgi:hypothetical protein
MAALGFRDKHGMLTTARDSSRGCMYKVEKRTTLFPPTRNAKEYNSLSNPDKAFVGLFPFCAGRDFRGQNRGFFCQKSGDLPAFVNDFSRVLVAPL